MSQPSITTIGSALVDIFVASSAFELQPSQDGVKICQDYGDKIDVDSFQLRTGGGGSNTAVGLARLGFSVQTIAELGQDVWSQFVLSELEKEAVDTQYVIRERKEETGGSILLRGSDGGRTALVHRGAAAMLNPKDISPHTLQSSDWIHLASIGGQVETLKHIFSAVSKHQQAAGQPGLSWNPGQQEIQALLDDQVAVSDLPVDLLFVNDTEWEQLQPIGPQLEEQIEYVIITKGKQGGEVRCQQKCVHTYLIDQVEPVDETGAGDAFATGYVAGHLNGLSPDKACEWGKANAASVVQQVGAKPGLLTRDQLQ